MGKDSNLELDKALKKIKSTQLQRISSTSIKRAKEYKNSDVLAPLRLPISVFASAAATSFLILAVKSSWLSIFPAAILITLIGYYLRAYEYWMKQDPDRLQTESYRLDSQFLDLFGEKGLSIEEATQLSEAEGATDDPSPPHKVSASKAKLIEGSTDDPSPPHKALAPKPKPISQPEDTSISNLNASNQEDD